MGAFTQAVAALAPHGVLVIPTSCDVPSRPMVKAPDKIGLATIRELATSGRFEGANAAIVTGARSHITIVDIDQPGEEAMRQAIQIFGETPLTVRTPSGGHHLWYRYAGERRSVRVRGLPLKVDVLGSGLAVCPPSRRPASDKKAAGNYAIISGSFNEIPNLPPIKWRPENDRSGERPTIGSTGLDESVGRNATLFRIACRLGTDISEEALMLELNTINQEFSVPLPDEEIDRIVRSVARYKTEGRLFGAGARIALGEQSEILTCSEYPPAMVLLAYLRSVHSRNPEFVLVPEGLAPTLHLASRTVRRARDFLVEHRLLTRISQGGRINGQNVPAKYRFGRRS